MQNRPTNQKSYNKFVAKWKESMQQATDIANKNAGKAQCLNRATYDRKLYGKDIDVGNWVLLRNNSE